MPAVVVPPTIALPPLDDVDDLDLSLCGWDGDPIDVDAIVDGLIGAGM
jgi:hypothetical protein